MAKLVFWGIALIATIFLVDRLLLWLESRGWLYYRRTRGRGGGALYHTLELHSVFDPSIEEVIEIMYHEEQDQDESGEPPAPDQLNEVPPT